MTCLKYNNVYGDNKGGQVEKMDVLTLDENKLIAQKCSVVCIDFISYRQGHSIQSDPIFGNNLGDISTYSNSKYFILKE